ncbi:MAG: hypothetical protein IKQ92_02170 [Clostridia bacterium]|nr:hypothetical protein [Clostridia bacterium]
MKKRILAFFALLLLFSMLSVNIFADVIDPPEWNQNSEPETEQTEKSGCRSFVDGGAVVLVTVLGSAWIAKRR